MLLAAIIGPRQCEVVERAAPKRKDNFVIVKVTVAPMCTEYKSYQAGQVSEVVGHEAAGEVVEVAPGSRTRIGERVVLMPLFPCGKCELCTSGDYIYCEHKFDPQVACESETGASTYAQYALKQDWLLLPIPDDISTDHAAMTLCGMGPTFGAMQRMHVDAFDTLLITGMGPVGLGGVINAVYRGARVIAVESNPYRANLALELGAEAVIDPNDPDAYSQVRLLTKGRGVDKAIDCTAVPEAQAFAISATRTRGQIAFVGWGGHIELGNMVPGGLTLHGSWHYNWNDVSRLLQVVRACQSSIDRLITHRFPLSRVQDAWELQLTGQCGKVLLYPWE